MYVKLIADDFIIYSAGREEPITAGEDAQDDNDPGAIEPLHVTLEELFHENIANPMPGT